MEKLRYGVILAAGRGTRMGERASILPKPLLPNPDICLLAHQIELMSKIATDIFVTVGEKSDLVVDFLQRFPNVEFINTNGLPNASFLNLKPFSQIKGHVAVLTCDNPMEIDVQSLLAEIKDKPSVSFLVGVTLSSSMSEVSGDSIAVFQKKIVNLGKNLNTRILASGLQIIKIENIERSKIADWDFYRIWERLIAERLLELSDCEPSKWFAVDNPSQLDAWVNR